MLWKAMAYQSTGNIEAGIEICEQLDKSDSRLVRKQANDLKMVLEAPQLGVSEDERVKIPGTERVFVFSLCTGSIGPNCGQLGN